MFRLAAATTPDEPYERQVPGCPDEPFWVSVPSSFSKEGVVLVQHDLLAAGFGGQ